MATKSHGSDTRCSIISFNDNISDDYADTQTLSQRNRIRSPSTRTITGSVATTSTSTQTHPLESAARLSRVTTNDSDLDTSSEMSDLDFLNMSAEEYVASALASAATNGSVVYTGTDGRFRWGLERYQMIDLPLKQQWREVGFVAVVDVVANFAIYVIL